MKLNPGHMCCLRHESQVHLFHWFLALNPYTSLRNTYRYFNCSSTMKFSFLDRHLLRSYHAHLHELEGERSSTAISHWNEYVMFK